MCTLLFYDGLVDKKRFLSEPFFVSPLDVSQLLSGRSDKLHFKSIPNRTFFRQIKQSTN